MTNIENKPKAQLTRELSEVLAEGREKYGENLIVVNRGTEAHPNWIAVHQTQKGSGGIKMPDMFDPSWYKNPAT